MGKRKSAQKAPAKKKLAKLETIFDCPFCSHPQTIEIKINREKMTGTVLCRVCDVRWMTDIHDLMVPIDVYTAFIDSCESANNSGSREPDRDRDLDSDDDK
eukprot:c9378_g1_i10.p2 GENE.c9378_g1_i10~~c9378_g1_i10.p2  ORF type:complete len:101 (-),score=21.58 c9378_g1_i10:1051-1353(-)